MNGEVPGGGLPPVDPAAFETAALPETDAEGSPLALPVQEEQALEELPTISRMTPPAESKAVESESADARAEQLFSKLGNHAALYTIGHILRLVPRQGSRRHRQQIMDVFRTDERVDEIILSHYTNKTSIFRVFPQGRHHEAPGVQNVNKYGELAAALFAYVDSQAIYLSRGSYVEACFKALQANVIAGAELLTDSKRHREVLKLLAGQHALEKLAEASGRDLAEFTARAVGATALQQEDVQEPELSAAFDSQLLQGLQAILERFTAEGPRVVAAAQLLDEIRQLGISPAGRQFEQTWPRALELTGIRTPKDLPDFYVLFPSDFSTAAQNEFSHGIYKVVGAVSVITEKLLNDGYTSLPRQRFESLLRQQLGNTSQLSGDLPAVALARFMQKFETGDDDSYFYLKNRHRRQ